MENGICEYCGYKEEAKPKSADGSSRSNQAFVQSTVVINHAGASGSDAIPGISKKSKTTALLLCIFLGLFGIHRFYVGKVGTGLIYMFSWGLFGVGWIVDIVMIATGSFKDQFDLPLRK